MRIFLTGMPGSGKSYWMQQLSVLFQYRSVDLDHFIEESEAQSIAELFRRGEAHFRKKERKALEAVIVEYPGQTVIATGGGAPCYKDNLQLMKTSGLVLYLENNIEALIANVAQPGIDRPLLANGSRRELAEKLSGLYQARKEIYEQAHIKIAVHQASLSTFAEAIDNYLSDHNLSL